MTIEEAISCLNMCTLQSHNDYDLSDYDLSEVKGLALEALELMIQIASDKKVAPLTKQSPIPEKGCEGCWVWLSRMNFKRCNSCSRNFGDKYVPVEN